MNLREWSRTHRVTRADLSRVVSVKRLRERRRIVFILPAGVPQGRPRAMLAAYEARFPAAVLPTIQGEPIGRRFARTIRDVYLNRPAIRAALRMELID